MGTHESAAEHYGDHEDDHAPDAPLTRLQIFLQRTYGGWPLYTIVISLGQLLAAVRLRVLSIVIHQGP
jgi:alpha-1,3-glucan synthase